MNDVTWTDYIDDRGDMELPKYLYNSYMNLMKTSLDMGTLLSNDHTKLRAFKEQTKSIFKKRWLDLAQALEEFDIIAPCSCRTDMYCAVCGGSRYRLNMVMSPDQIQEIAVVMGTKDQNVEHKLQEGLVKAFGETR